jgi:hypothetical protein
LAVAGLVVSLLGLVAAAYAVTAPRLAGRYSTSLTITRVVHIVNVRAGESAVRTWTFRPSCASGGCTTTLDRPSIASASTEVYVYTLKPVSAREYKGSIKPILTPCFFQNGTQVANAYTTYQTLDLHATKVSRGRIAAYQGTQRTLVNANALGRSHGCPQSGEQDASFKSS